MANLYIPNSIALRNFDSIFKHNSFDFSDGQADITFHPNYVAMHPVGLAFYAALGDYFRANGIKTTAKINYEIRSIPYHSKNGAFQCIRLWQSYTYRNTRGSRSIYTTPTN